MKRRMFAPQRSARPFSRPTAAEHDLDECSATD